MATVKEQKELLKKLGQDNFFIKMPLTSSIWGGSCAAVSGIPVNGPTGIGIYISKKEKDHPLNSKEIVGRYELAPHTVKFFNGRKKYYAHVVTRHIKNLDRHLYDGSASAVLKTNTYSDTEHLSSLHHVYLAGIEAIKNKTKVHIDWEKNSSVNCSEGALELLKEQAKGKTAVFVFKTREYKNTFNWVVKELDGLVLWSTTHTNQVHDYAEDYLTSAIVRF